jgi:bisphosphoglycerate-independent phosphoglycerate mutase (AlkP superfamily)
MAISTTPSGRFYDMNRDEYYDSHTHYMRHMEHLRIQQMREEDRQRNMYSGQQQMNQNSIALQVGVEGYVVGVRPTVTDPKDPLAFLSKTDNKILLTGEAT